MIDKEFNNNLEEYYDFLVEDYLKLFKNVVLFSDGSYIEDFRRDLNKYAKKLFTSDKFKNEYYNFLSLNVEDERELERVSYNLVNRINQEDRKDFIVFVNRLYFSVIEEVLKNINVDNNALKALEDKNLLSTNEMKKLVITLMGNSPIVEQMVSIFEILYSNLIILMSIYILSFGNIKYAHSKNSNKCHSFNCRFVKNVKYINLRIVAEEEIDLYDKCKTCLK